jgi:branched-chain amino acid transport system permease protein
VVPRRKGADLTGAASGLAPATRHATGIALEVKDVTVRYGNVVALDGVNLTVPAGKVVGLIGPNGAGKSTIVDAITGFFPSYRGSVLLNGTALEGKSATARALLGIRRTWQTTRIAAELTVGEYIRLAAGPISHTELTRGARLDRGAPDRTRRLPLSMPVPRRLLDVAGVVAARPPVILLDEPRCRPILCRSDPAWSAHCRNP